jgi:hypothetical protein
MNNIQKTSFELPNYEDKVSYFNALEKIVLNQSLFKHLRIDDQCKIEHVGLTSFLWEKIKGFAGGVDHTDQKQIEQRILRFIEYGINKGWIETDQIQKIRQVVKDFQPDITIESVQQELHELGQHVDFLIASSKNKTASLFNPLAVIQQLGNWLRKGEVSVPDQDLYDEAFIERALPQMKKLSERMVLLKKRLEQLPLEKEDQSLLEFNDLEKKFETYNQCSSFYGEYFDLKQQTIEAIESVADTEMALREDSSDFFLSSSSSIIQNSYATLINMINKYEDLAEKYHSKNLPEQFKSEVLRKRDFQIKLISDQLRELNTVLYEELETEAEESIDQAKQRLNAFQSNNAKGFSRVEKVYETLDHVNGVRKFCNRIVKILKKDAQFFQLERKLRFFQAEAQESLCKTFKDLDPELIAECEETLKHASKQIASGSLSEQEKGSLQQKLHTVIALSEKKIATLDLNLTAHALTVQIACNPKQIFRSIQQQRKGQFKENRRFREIENEMSPQMKNLLDFFFLYLQTEASNAPQDSTSHSIQIPSQNYSWTHLHPISTVEQAHIKDVGNNRHLA